MHPETGAIWENEHGPLGGDEINIVLPGRNYGWPLVTFGNDYDGKKISELTSRPDLEAPFMYWIPSIAISGMTFYTGDRFPAWKGNAFVGAMFQGRTRGTGHIQRITFNEGRPIQREPILTELRQRIRDVRQGPDGLLYVLTDEDNGALLRIEPVAAEVTEGPEERFHRRYETGNGVLNHEQRARRQAVRLGRRRRCQYDAIERLGPPFVSRTASSAPVKRVRLVSSVPRRRSSSSESQQSSPIAMRCSRPLVVSSSAPASPSWRRQTRRASRWATSTTAFATSTRT